MTSFDYGKAISDSFKLVLRNLYVFVPLLVVSIISIFFSSWIIKVFGVGNGVSYFVSNIGVTLIFCVLYIMFIILYYIAYGWTFSMMGSIVKNGRSSLSSSFSSAGKKGLTYFLTTIIIALLVIAWVVLILIPLMIGGGVSLISNILGGIVMGVLIFAWFIGLIAIALSVMYILPVIALENIGPVRVVRKSIIHFRRHKLHTLALLAIIAFFLIIPFLMMYGGTFAVMGSVKDDVISGYIAIQPVTYSIVSWIFSLPLFFMGIWSIAFITIAYVRNTAAPQRLSAPKVKVVNIPAAKVVRGKKRAPTKKAARGKKTVKKKAVKKKAKKKKARRR